MCGAGTGRAALPNLAVGAARRSPACLCMARPGAAARCSAAIRCRLEQARSAAHWLCPNSACAGQRAWLRACGLHIRRPRRGGVGRGAADGNLGATACAPATATLGCACAGNGLACSRACTRALCGRRNRLARSVWRAGLQLHARRNACTAHWLALPDMARHCAWHAAGYDHACGRGVHDWRARHGTWR